MPLVREDTRDGKAGQCGDSLRKGGQRGVVPASAASVAARVDFDEHASRLSVLGIDGRCPVCSLEGVNAEGDACLRGQRGEPLVLAWPDNRIGEEDVVKSSLDIDLRFADLGYR